MISKPEPDERLLAARDLALAALHEITPSSTVGPAAGYLLEEDGSVSLRFENRLPGYPGWFWTVTVARVEDAEPTVLEVELLPGDGALLAPDWVPWAERLAEYRAHQAELAEQAAAETAAADEDAEDSADADEDLDDEDLEDEDEDLGDGDFDEDDEGDDVSPRLHAGDLDGVDIDELDDSVLEDEDEDEGDESEAEGDLEETPAGSDDMLDDSEASGDPSEEE